MSLKAKVVKMFTEKNDKGYETNWVIVETFGQYPNFVAFTNYKDKEGRLKVPNIEVGKIYDFEYNIVSREWNNRWFTDVRLWKATADSTQPPTYENPAQQAQPIPLAQMPESDNNSDLPF